MNPKEAPTLDCIERGPAEATASVIWLHGLGADGYDFEPIVPELGLPPNLLVRFIFPHAPIRPVTINMGMRMRAWYDILGFDKSQEDEPGIRESTLAVMQLIQRERERGVRSDRIVLAGFSQGAALSIHTAVRAPERLGGVIALSGYLLLRNTLPAELDPIQQRLPMFVAHGRHDPVVPFAWGEGTRDRLVELGFEIEWHDYPMPHSVCAPQIVDIGAWLQRRLVPAG
jgi:phospholipase/carboxylesterase